MYNMLGFCYNTVVYIPQCALLLWCLTLLIITRKDMLEKAGREFTCAISLLMPQNMKSDVSPLEEGKKIKLRLE